MGNRWVIVVVVALLLGTALGWRLMSGGSTVTKAGSAPSEIAEPVLDAALTADASPAQKPPTLKIAAPAAPLRQSPPPATSTPPNPLPGALPLAELVPLLEARARAGDGAAACRLGVELSKCRHMLRSLPTAPDEQMDETRWREQGRSDAQIASLRDQRRRRLHQRAACEALPPELIDRAPWFMLQAALAGNASAMVAFARLEGVTMAGLVADPALYEQYRLHAFGLWERALHQGSMDALWLWYGAVNDGWQ
ncbi:MAG: hypothetical protein KDI37_10335, partial [Xanthomonadales bacterium]|nr:hypothetical protein [Xanthomonadales bacterium]